MNSLKLVVIVKDRHEIDVNSVQYLDGLRTAVRYLKSRSGVLDSGVSLYEISREMEQSDNDVRAGFFNTLDTFIAGREIIIRQV